MRKKVLALVMLLLVGNICTACGNDADTAPAVTQLVPLEPVAPAISVTEAPTITRNPNSMAQPTTSPLASSVSWLEISPEENLTVYVSEDCEHPQVVVCRDEFFYTFDWDYDLAYGDPIVFVEDNDIYYKLKWIDKQLVICLPTAELTEPLSPIEAREICGEEHLLDYENLFCEIPSHYGREREELTAAYRHGEEDGRVLALAGSDGEIFVEFPEIELPEQEQYPVVYDTAIHFTDTRMRYQRVGITVEGGTVWLGKYCNNILFPDADKGYRIGTNKYGSDAGCGSYRFAWQARPIEPDALLDLDGDGMAEKISYRWISSENSRNDSFCIWINGRKQELDIHSELSPQLFTASLDGKASQLIALDFGVGRSQDFIIFQYENGVLSRAGQFCDAKYWLEDDNGKNVYVSTGYCHPLQIDQFYMKQEFVDGTLHEITQDYYEFTALYQDVPDKAPERNVLCTKERIELYYEKEGNESFSVAEGSDVVFLGSDLKGWILIENRDTKEKGWLQVKMEQRSASICILPDGREAAGADLFDGLIDYD